MNGRLLVGFRTVNLALFTTIYRPVAQLEGPGEIILRASLPLLPPWATGQDEIPRTDPNCTCACAKAG